LKRFTVEEIRELAAEVWPEDAYGLATARFGTQIGAHLSRSHMI
jgi:hypothetical protein